MTSRKLSESDKQEMLQLYRQPGETTSTLADRYSVSNSTISRILKSSFSEAEYETLIQQKRGSRSSSEAIPLSSDGLEASVEAIHEPLVLEATAVGAPIAVDASAETAALLPVLVASAVDETTEAIANGRRLRKRSSAPSEPPRTIAPPVVRPGTPKATVPEANAPKVIDLTLTSAADGITFRPDAIDDAADPTYAEAIDADEALLSEELLSAEADLVDDLEDDDLDDEDDDLDDEDDLDDDDLDDDLENGALLLGGRIAGKALVQVLPLAVASLPRTCYLVVDRSAELIARPLKEFGDLGQIPEAEVLEKTLPVFDNHRVAKRYSNPRTQRVIKLPDAQVLQKTSAHLQAKGITRLLIDGQVYAL